MYERTSRLSKKSTKVYICPKCNAVVYVWPDGELKEEDQKDSR